MLELGSGAYARAAGIVLALVVAGCGDDDAGLCNPAALTAALANAGPGDTVRVGECEVTGAFTVPAGVTIAGSSSAASVIHGPTGEVALRLAPGTAVMQTRATALTVREDGPVGVYASGAGEIALQDLSVTAGAAATHGIALDGVSRATLTNVDVSGFAGRGVLVRGGNATLTAVHVTGTRAFATTVGFGVAITDGANVTTTGLTVSGTEGIGVFHDMAQGAHTDLVSSDNSLPGVWVQNTSAALSLAISGVASALHGNGGAGLVAVDSRNITLADMVVDASRTVDVFGVTFGDGMQFVRTYEAVAFRDMVVRDSPRIQVFCAGGTAPGAASASPTWNNVTVDGTGDALGCIDDESFPENWDLGVMRAGATRDNDAAFTPPATPIPVTGVIGPMDFPRASELPAF